jgi:hypothetical protein
MVHRLTVLLPLALAACAHVPAPPDASSMNPLVGSWHLERVVAIRPSGEATISRWGKNPSGLITYTGDGRMAAQISGIPGRRSGIRFTPPPRSSRPWSRPTSPTPEPTTTTP